MTGAWFLLGCAAVGEVIWASTLARSDGFRHLGYAAVSTLAAIATIACLGLALRRLPLGPGYATWTGLGIIGTALVGWYSGEAFTARRALWLTCILIGVIGLHFEVRHATAS